MQDHQEHSHSLSMVQVPTLGSRAAVHLQFLVLVVNRAPVAKSAVQARIVKLEIQPATSPMSSLGTLISEGQRITCLSR